MLKVGLSSFVASIVSFLLFKAYHGVIRHSTLRGLWRIGGAAIGKSLLMFLLLWLLKARFSPFYLLVGWNHGQYVDDRDVGHVACLRDQCL